MNKEDIINLVETIGKLSKENTNLYGILIDIVKELSVIYPKHEFETLPAKVKEVVQRLIEVEERNKQLSKRHPTKEEALAQYNWLKENSTRNK